MEHTYIDGSVITKQVIKRLRSFYEAGILDLSLASDQIQKGLQDIGIKQGESNLETVLLVVGGKARLPDGLVDIEEAWFGNEPVYPLNQSSKGRYYYIQKNNVLQVDSSVTNLRLVYRGSRPGNELPNVPTDLVIQDYLVKKIVYEQLKDWFYNNEVANIQQQIQFASQELLMAHDNAYKQEQTPSFKDLYNYKTQRPRSMLPFK